MADLIEDAIDEKYGPRCDTFEADCWTCQVWQQYDALHEAGERARERALEEAIEIVRNVRIPADLDGCGDALDCGLARIEAAIRALKGRR